MNKVILSTLILLLAVQGLNAQTGFGIFDFFVAVTISIASFAINVTLTAFAAIIQGVTYVYASFTSTAVLYIYQVLNPTLYQLFANIQSYIQTQLTLDARSLASVANISYFNGSASYLEYLFANASLAQFNTSNSAIAWSLATFAASLIGRGNCVLAPFYTTYNCSAIPAYNTATNCSTASLTTQAFYLNASADIVIDKIYSYAAYLQRMENFTFSDCSCPTSTNASALVNGWLNLKASATAAINVTLTNCTLMANINATAGAEITSLLNATWSFLRSGDSCTNCAVLSGLRDGYKVFDWCSPDGTYGFIYGNYSNGLTCQQTNNQTLQNIWSHFLTYYQNKAAIFRNTTYWNFQYLANYTTQLYANIQQSRTNYNNLVNTYVVASIKTAAAGVSSSLLTMINAFPGQYATINNTMFTAYVNAQAQSSASYTNYTNSVSAQAQALASLAISVNGTNCTIYANVSAEAVANYSSACVECANAAELKFREINTNASVFFKNTSDIYQGFVNLVDLIYSLKCSAASYYVFLSPYYGGKCPNDNVIWFNWLWGSGNINALNTELNKAKTLIVGNTTLIANQTAIVANYVITEYANAVQTYLYCIGNSSVAASSALATAQIGFDNCYAPYTTTTLAPTPAP